MIAIIFNLFFCCRKWKRKENEPDVLAFNVSFAGEFGIGMAPKEFSFEEFGDGMVPRELSFHELSLQQQIVLQMKRSLVRWVLKQFINVSPTYALHLSFFHKFEEV
ncbi:hypothetical protein SLA2020_199420 [Shorea laevis]